MTMTSTPMNNELIAGSDRNHHHREKQSILRNKVILSILITETAERVAYFGFRAILVLYFHNSLQLSESTSIAMFSAVSGLAYFSPLLGALIADSAWGRYLVILRFGTVYSIGLCLITLAAYEASSCSLSVNSDRKECINTDVKGENSHEIITIARLLTGFGLILVCLGTGGIKPCVSAFGADQVVLLDKNPIERRSTTASSSTTKYSHIANEDITDEVLTAITPGILIIESSSRQESDRIREFFNSFYFCINVGALFSFAIVPIIRANYGFGAAFLIPTLFMTVALGVFLSQRKAYKHRKRDSSQPSLFRILKMCSTIVYIKYFQHFISADITASEIEGEKSETTGTTKTEDIIESNEENKTHQERQDAEQVLHLMPLMLFFPIFWTLYDQQGSVWTLQATHLNCHGLEPEQSGFLNPMEIMILIPLFDQIIYPWLDSKGYNIQPLRRMQYGMFLAAVAFFASTLLEFSIQRQPANSISVAWQIPQITILTIAEIFLFMTAIGDGMGAILFASVFRQLNLCVTMIICALCMLFNLALFSMVARNWKPYQPNNLQRLDNNDDGVELNTIVTNREMN